MRDADLSALSDAGGGEQLGDIDGGGIPPDSQQLHGDRVLRASQWHDRRGRRRHTHVQVPQRERMRRWRQARSLAQHGASSLDGKDD